jgi:hypothetical protein
MNLVAMLTLITSPALLRAALPILLICLLYGCRSHEPAPGATALHAEGMSKPVALIETSELEEISGIAASTRSDDLLWMINDSGNTNQLHAVDANNGNLLASITVAGISNVDWEDMAAFELDGEHWLLIADVGDNNARRRYGHLYLLPEPDSPVVGKAPDDVTISAEIVFGYADGARDVEAVAVDTQRREIVLVSKRKQPPGVHILPLTLTTTRTPLLAQRIADVNGLLPPTAVDRLRFGRYTPYVAQPTALDIHMPTAVDQPVSAVLLTYKNAYLFQRRAGADWGTAWQRPEVITVPPMQQTEAVAFDRSGCSLWVTTEQLPAPMHRIDSGLCDQLAY